MIESICLTVTGMKCSGCETNVTEKLQVLDGVLTVTALSKENQVSIEFDTDKITITAIQDTITVAGFTVIDDD